MFVLAKSSDSEAIASWFRKIGDLQMASGIPIGVLAEREKRCLHDESYVGIFSFYIKVRELTAILCEI